MAVEDYGFYPPVFGPQGQAQPHPKARYLHPEQITEFAQALKAEMKEIGGLVFLNKCEHIFRRLDDQVGAQMQEDHNRAQALAVERGEKSKTPLAEAPPAKSKAKTKAESKAKAKAESKAKAKAKAESKAESKAKAKAESQALDKTKAKAKAKAKDKDKDKDKGTKGRKG
jgi:membrane protein involved in colicin uptake